MDLTALGRFHVAPGYDPSAPATWIWTDRSQDVRHTGSGAAVAITGDRGDEVSDVNSSSCRLQVDNTGGHYCDENPMGRWYGLLDIGCPARWGTICGAEAWTTNTSNGWGTPDVGTSWSVDGTASDWSSAGGVGQVLMTAAPAFHQGELVGANARNGEATFVCAAPVVATGASLVCSLTARRTVGVSQILFSVDFGTGGTLGARIKRDSGGGLTDIGGTPTVGTYTAGQRIKARCQWDGQDLRLRVWPEASSEPTTWSTTATDSQCTGSAVAIHSWRVVGNSNAGNLTFTYDDLEVEAVEIVGTLPALPVEWDMTGGLSWASLEIAGITRRLSQGKDLVRSPIYRQLSAQPAASYWPLEDAAGTLSASSGLPGGLSATVLSGTFGSSDCPAGAASALTLNTTGTSRVIGRVTRWALPRDGYATMCYLRIPSPPVSETKTIEITAAGTITRWVIYMSSTTVRIEGYTSDGTLTINPAGNLWITDPTAWFAIQLEAAESGATVNWALIWHQVGGSVFFAQSGSFTGTSDQVFQATVFAPADGTLVSHLWMGDDLLPFVDSTFMLVSAGYAGELASDRIARLCADAGVHVAIEAGTSDPMGAQKNGRFLDLLRECETADQGVLYESGSGLGYRPRGARYNTPVQMALTFGPGGDLADSPKPVKDDQRARNLWTLSRPGGGERTASDPANILRRGPYPDSASANLNTDDRLLDHAYWRVHLGTWGRMRWPQIVVKLTDKPSLLSAWRGRPFGARITITGVPSQGPIGRIVDLIVEGWTQEITSHTWVVTLNCSPAGMWDVGVYDDSGSRYDSATSTIPAGATAGATTFTISTTDLLDLWDTAGGYDLGISGEQIGVPAAGMGAASGTGPYTQVVTGAVRAKNGISKAIPVNAEAHLFTQAHYAL